MTTMSAEVLVVGGGTMGLATAWALARRGAKVRVLERFGHVHTRGSHSGETRVIRHGYHEGSDYVRLVDRADRAWVELEERVGRPLLRRRGLVEFGVTDHPEFSAAREALEANGIEHEMLDARELARRWPLRMPEAWTATYSPRCGYLEVPACLDAFRDEASAAGVAFEWGTRVMEIVRGDSPALTLEDGRVLRADRIVVAAGAYAAALLPGLGNRGPRGPVRALRKVLGWVEPAAASVSALTEMPVWAAFRDDGFFYGFPHIAGQGFKLACHTVAVESEVVDPESERAPVGAEELLPLAAFLADHIPSAGDRWARSETCLYGQSADGHFIVDLDPRCASIVHCLGFSGHGFKFAPVIGEMAAQLALDGRSELQLSRFRWER